VIAQVGEERPAVQAVEGRFAGADGLEQVVPAAILLFADHDGERPQGLGPALAEGLGQRVEAEAPAGLLGEDAGAGQGAEQPVQRPGRHPDLDGQLLRRARAVLQVVGDSELRGGVDRPRDPGANDHLEQLLRGLRFAHVRLPFLECPHGRGLDSGPGTELRWANDLAGRFDHGISGPMGRRPARINLDCPRRS
jgi:hypothetical protein